MVVTKGERKRGRGGRRQVSGLGLDFGWRAAKTYKRGYQTCVHIRVGFGIIHVVRLVWIPLNRYYHS